MKEEGNDSALLWLHLVISNAKSYILGTYHGLDRMHLQRYLDEFCYRLNRRFLEAELFDRLSLGCVGGKTVTNQSLIIRKPKHGDTNKVNNAYTYI